MVHGGVCLLLCRATVGEKVDNCADSSAYGACKVHEAWAKVTSSGSSYGPWKQALSSGTRRAEAVLGRHRKLMLYNKACFSQIGSV